MNADKAERLQSSARLSDVILLAQEQLGPAYASAVIDNATRTLTLYSTAAVPAPVLEAINGITRSLFRVEVVRVTRSLDQLLAVQAVVNTLAATPAGREFGRCTSGFVWTTANEYLGSTAGHCLLNNSGFYLGTKHSTFYGFGYRNQFQQNPAVSADVVFVRGVPATKSLSPLVWEAPDKTSRVVGKMSNQPVGTAVRMIGAATIRGSVGLVIYEHFGGRSQDGDFVYTDATCATYGSSTGDSGAPVYKRKGTDGVEAHGMHFSSHFDSQTRKRDAGCYADVDNIERTGGIALLIG